MTDDQTASQETAPATAAPADDTPLGEAGKRALDAERTARREADTARKAAEDRAAKIASRLLHAEVLGAAKGKLADPAMAARLLDLTAFELGEDGYDSAAIAAAVDQLVNDRPFLGLTATGFQGSDSGGGQATGTRARQITSRAELKHMTPAQINAARREGRLDRLMKGDA